MQTADSTPHRNYRWNHGRTVVWGFVLLAVIFNVVVLFQVDNGLSGDELLIPAVLGVVCGELCVMAMLSGLTGRTWLGGYFCGLSMAILWYLAIVAFFWFKDSEELDPLIATCMVPWIVLVASSPLIALRHCGWRLVNNSAVPPPTFPFRIADLFHGTAMVAATMTLLRAPAVIWEESASNYWPIILIASGIVFALSLLVVPITTWLAFGLSSRAKSVIGLGLLAGSAYLVIVLISQCFFDWEASWAMRAEVLLPIAIVVSAAAAVLYSFMFFLSLTGIVLIRKRRLSRQAKHVDPANPEGTLPPVRSLPRSRWQIAAVIAVAILVNIGLARLQTWRRVRDQEIADLQQLASQRNGEVNTRDRAVFWIVLHHGATDADIEKFANSSSCQSLLYLDVNSDKLTDRSLESISRFSVLERLSIRKGAITEAGLAHLSKLKKLTTLDLTGVAITDRELAFLASLSLKKLTRLVLTKTLVSGAGLPQLADSAPIAELTLDRSQFLDAYSDVFPRMRHLTDLSLSDTAISDEGLRQLQYVSNLRSVYLAGTKVDGTGLQGCRNIQILDLRNSGVSDESIRTLLELVNLNQLFLAQTKITDRALDHLAQCQRLEELDLRHTQVSDAGVAKLALIVGLQRLNLSGTAITGECFRNWPPAPQLNLLLSETSITDAELPFIAKMGVDTLSLSATRVTANGILAAGFTDPNTTLVVRREHFTKTEIQQLESGLAVKIHFEDGEPHP